MRYVGKVFRPPSEAELLATTVLRIPLTEASAKIRSGAPIDAAADQTLNHWAGVLPLELKAGAPIPDEGTGTDAAFPTYLRNYRRGGNS